MHNRIRPLREARHWSQHDLAAAAGTSQQQVARIESGSQSARLDLACAIATALGAELHQVFPEIRRPPKPRARRRETDAADPGTWLLSFRLRGGAAFDFVIPTADVKRLRARLAEQAPATPFFVFDSGSVSAAVNVDHLLHYQELWDGSPADEWDDERVTTDRAAIFLAESAEPLTFEVAANPAHRHLLATLDAAVGPREFVSLQDADGEEALFRAAEIVALTIPRSAVG